jgi:hypothetical protein
MEIPVEARQAFAWAMEHVGTHGLAIGEPVTCRRMEVPPDHPANLLARLPQPFRTRAEGMLARIPEGKGLRSHWLFGFHNPATRKRDDPYTATLLCVFDDGEVDLKAHVRLESVHVFISTGRFRVLRELRAFLDPTYTQDGEMVPSTFMREVQLSGYEPDCIEAVCVEQPVSLFELLAQASYADCWLRHLETPSYDALLADAAVCVFPPNRVGNALGGSIKYLGAFEYIHSRLA